MPYDFPWWLRRVRIRSAVFNPKVPLDVRFSNEDALIVLTLRRVVQQLTRKGNTVTIQFLDDALTTT